MLLQEKVHVQGRDPATNITLWDEFREDFFQAWGDTTKAQRADLEIQKHTMKGKSIDKYTSTFKVLLRRVGWTRDDQSTIKEFIQGLPMWLANRIMARSPPLNKARLSEWIYAARDVMIPAVTPTFSSTSRPAASPEAPCDTSSSHVPLGSHVIHPCAPSSRPMPRDPVSRPCWV